VRVCFSGCSGKERNVSLVEKALRKLQAGSSAANPSQPTGVAQSGTDPGLDRIPARQPTTLVAKGRRTRLGGGKAIAVDVANLRAQGILPPQAQERQLADQYRTIKRSVLKQALLPAQPTGTGEASRRLIMITSALPGDGKTLTAINLALSLSRERDYSVLLVDADVAKRDVSRILGLNEEPGLLDLLADPALAIERAIAPTDFPGLSVLPAGSLSETATELLASARMHEVIAGLTALDPQCLIVLDSPPILLTSEAPVLAPLFGQIVVVVMAGQTPQQAVVDAIRVIGPSDRVSLVLNQADTVGPSGYQYGFGYGYGYGYGGPPAESENSNG
jgi:protein-tyrosine kinase